MRIIVKVELPEAGPRTKIRSSEVRIFVLCSSRVLPGRILRKEAELLRENPGGPGGLGLHQVDTGLGSHCSGGQWSLASL